jgi:hypothetical protein
MAVTLRNALLCHKAFLGDDYSNLGKKNWIYLSYDAHAGWGESRMRDGWVLFSNFSVGLGSLRGPI